MNKNTFCAATERGQIEIKYGCQLENSPKDDEY